MQLFPAVTGETLQQGQMAKPFIEGSFKMNKISSIIMPFNRLQAILQMIPRAPDSISITPE